VDPHLFEGSVFSRHNIPQSFPNSSVVPWNSVPGGGHWIEPGMKMEPLKIPKFDGSDVTSFPDFWNRFRISFHDRPNMSKATKLQYLLEYTSGRAKDPLNHLDICDESYDQAIEILMQRYGRRGPCINKHVSSLLSISTVAEKADPSSLRKFSDEIAGHVRALKSLKVNLDEDASYILAPVLFSRFPSDIRLQWAINHEDDDLTVSKLLSFLEKQVQNRERSNEISSMYCQDQCVQKKDFKPSSRKMQHPPSPRRSGFRHTISLHTKSDTSIENAQTKSLQKKSSGLPPCPICKRDHHPKRCQQLTKVPTKELVALIKKSNRCFRCLGPHFISECKGDLSCPKCHGSHHPILCLSQSANAAPSSNPSTEVNVNLHSSSMESTSRSVRLFQTAVVTAHAPERSVTFRCVFDSGSDLTYASSRLLKALGVKSTGEKVITIGTFGGSSIPSSARKVFVISLSKSVPAADELFDIEVIESAQICRQLQPPPKDISQFPHLMNLPLADVYPHGSTPTDPDSIDLLIGLDNLPRLLKSHMVQGLPGEPIAQETAFGYVVFGTLQLPRLQPLSGTQSTCLLTQSMVPADVSLALSNFWSLEGLGIEPPKKADSAEDVLLKFNDTICFKDGRYEVQLPWINDAPPLSDNFQSAFKRFRSLQNKLSHSPDLKLQYTGALDEYRTLGFVETVPPGQYNSANQVFYLPHHPVVRSDKLSTRVRPVFDGSARSPSGYSLNDCLHTGPRIGSDIFDILLRFRFCRVAFTSDLQKAFLQVAIHPKDRDVCRFLTEDDNRLLITQRFCRVPFGLVSSPFLLAATIEFHLSKQPPSKVTEALSKDRYVDDFIHGEDTVEEAFGIAREGVEIFRSAGMSLRQFQTNSCELRDLLQQHEVPLKQSDSPISKVLGMQWFLDEDLISPPSIPQLCCKELLTKRILLSEVSKVYDPLGLACPLVIPSKLMIQLLWKSGLGWDDPVTEDLKFKCRKALEYLGGLTDIKIPRRVTDSDEELSLHLFCDSSPEAYASAVYLRSKTSCSLYAAKSRVAPIDPLKLPRLELVACFIGSRLLSRIRQEVPQLSDVPVYAYTDSTIALSWIASPPHAEVFITNRVKEIVKLLPNVPWNHVASEDNPADFGTRSSSPISFRKNPHLWFHGPSWLRRSPEHWPVQQKTSTPQVLTSQSLPTPDPSENIFHPERHSSLNRLLRSTHYVLEFISKLRTTQPSSRFITLDGSAHERALIILLQQVQSSSFPDELSSLSSGQPLSKKSPLANLKPFLNSVGLLCSLGRTRRIEDVSGLIILPSRSSLTNLIILQSHADNLHCGVEITLSALRTKYWIIKGRQAVKHTLRSCLICRRSNAKPYVSPESDLPLIRITQARPFSRVGIDYFGPFLTSDHGKCWGILITCCVSRAIYLDCVLNMSATTLLNVLSRFESRFGPMEIVLSDNAKAFKKVGELLSFRLSWRFIPDRSPHWGGFYERMIGTVKSCLKRTIWKSILTFDDFLTTLIRIEGVINQRPLTYVGDDPTDPLPLRPIDLLKPKIMIERGAQREKMTADVLREAHRNAQVAFNSFWNAWQTEYLALLRRWRRPETTGSLVPAPGHVVQVKATNTKNRCYYPLGVITSLIHGVDGRIRAAWVRTSHGMLRRGIHLLFPLECPEEKALTSSFDAAGLDSGDPLPPGALDPSSQVVKPSSDVKKPFPEAVEPSPHLKPSPPTIDDQPQQSRYGRRYKRPMLF
jgi:hypothetical protein